MVANGGNMGMCANQIRTNFDTSINHPHFIKFYIMTWKHPGVRYSEYMEKYGKPYYGTNEEAMKAKQEEKRFKKRKYKPH